LPPEKSASSKVSHKLWFGLIIIIIIIIIIIAWEKRKVFSLDLKTAKESLLRTVKFVFGGNCAINRNREKM